MESPATLSAPEPAKTRVTLPSRRRRIVEALTQTGGNRAEAARLLGMGRTTLYRLIQQFGLEISEED
jgi:transcriptional regulator of acetoin/glycerol metabolism